MAYSEFNLSKVAERFDLEIGELDVYSTAVEQPISSPVAELLRRYQPLARAIATEKARSEYLIAPMLEEVKFFYGNQISLFSGIELAAAPELGLNGICDFLLTRSSQQLYLTRPIVVVVEAKNENLSSGFGQCIAEMVGARIYNQSRNFQEPVLYGVVTTGTSWRFLLLQDQVVIMDKTEFSMENPPKILGILTMMMAEPSGTAAPPTTANDPKGPQ